MPDTLWTSTAGHIQWNVVLSARAWERKNIQKLNVFLHLQSTGHQTWRFSRGWWDGCRTPGFLSSTTPLWNCGRNLGKLRVLRRSVKIARKQNRLRREGSIPLSKYWNLFKQTSLALLGTLASFYILFLPWDWSTSLLPFPLINVLLCLCLSP